MEQVAKACRISKRTVYELFPSKASLLRLSSPRTVSRCLPCPATTAIWRRNRRWPPSSGWTSTQRAISTGSTSCT
ncbi:TetR/AcrR family transcriptional regulator [Pannonibacter phragmitetus]|uniref:TetR/AcrR family transcriptional regulator n=1 Tax=Pannonibacter phragmitetus TaxID=121719 RepID=UPI003D7C5E50